VQLHEDHPTVFVLKKDLDKHMKSPTASIFLRQMVDKVYTREALRSATPGGFSARGKGKVYYKKKARAVKPRLHPDGLEALAGKFFCFTLAVTSLKTETFGYFNAVLLLFFSAKVIALGGEIKHWRPKLSPAQIQSILSNKICGFKVASSSSSSEDDSDSYSSDSSSSDSSSARDKSPSSSDAN